MRVNLLQTLSGIETPCWGNMPIVVLSVNLLQTLSGIETKIFRQGTTSSSALIYSKPFQGLKRFGLYHRIRSQMR